ncbi:MAG: ABC transporter permease [Roseburia sp.]|nr:ABC transporter permease [Ruminococcus sp.]MCM1155190.1 ABC transporter permease [Roseburia sp.]MCM1242636.1 ABC transporter permease [Roseburia sp.]
MKLAWKELVYSKKKYILIELIIVLLVFMVLFLSGLVEGLGRAVISGIEDMDADYFLLSDSAESLITVSDLDLDVYAQADGQTDAELAVLDIQRMYLTKADDTEKMNITYFAVERGSFLEPSVAEGVQFGDADVENPIILDDDFQSEGIETGDIVSDSSTGLEFTVIGFAKDQMYGHTSIGFIPTDTYHELRTLLNPLYEKSCHAVVIRGTDIENIRIEGTELISKADIVENIPSYKAEHMTITMIIWVLEIVTAVVIGVFYYILTLQKQKQFGVMKAIGVEMKLLAGMAAGQVCMIAVFGALLAAVLTYGMAAALPQAMPFYLKNENVCILLVVFILVSIASSLISMLNIAKVDPMKVIGGADE